MRTRWAAYQARRPRCPMLVMCRITAHRAPNRAGLVSRRMGTIC